MSWYEVSSSISFVSMGLNLSFLGVVLVLDLDLFFPSFVPCPSLLGEGIPVASLLGEVCGDPSTEATLRNEGP